MHYEEGPGCSCGNSQAHPDSATLTQLIAMLRQREAGGRKEYGQTVDRTDFTHVDWLREALHESMDKRCTCSGRSRRR